MGKVTIFHKAPLVALNVSRIPSRSYIQITKENKEAEIVENLNKFFKNFHKGFPQVFYVSNKNVKKNT